MMLRTARRYDIHTDSIVFANNQPYTRDQYASSGLSGVPDTLFPFCRYLCLMKVDNAEYALLTAIVVFSGAYQRFTPLNYAYEDRVKELAIPETQLSHWLDLHSLFQNTPIITPKKRTIQPGYAFEYTAFNPGGLKLSNFKPGCRVSALHFFVK